jgi:hypothetical protein
VNKLLASIIYVAPSYYVGAVAILVNCSDHSNFGNGNNVCVHDQIEVSVEKLQQDPLVSFGSFPAEFVNVEEILGQQLFSGLHIDNDVSVEEIVSFTITTRGVLGSDNLTSFWETQMKVSESFILSSYFSVTLSSNSTQVHIVGGKKLISPTLQSLLFYPPLYFIRRNFDHSRSIFDGTA